MSNRLNILYPTSFYPHIDGGFLRTFNIAKIASSVFDETNLVATDEKISYRNKYGSLNLVQDLRYKGHFDKMAYYYEGVFSKSFSWRVPKKFLKGDYFFQIEEPLFYNALMKKGIKTYILDEHNVNWRIYALPGSNIKEKVFRYLTRNRNLDIEKKALLDAYKIMVCSEIDRKILIEALPQIEEKILIIPNCVNFIEYEEYLNSHERNENEKTVVFIGTFDYFPNLDALKIICKLAKILDDITFKVIGKNPPCHIKYPDNIEIKGYVDDIKREIMNSDLCIAPIRYGSGTRLKILEYMAMGKPVISTKKAAEGIEYTKGKNIVIEDNILKMANLIEELVENEKEKKRLGKNAKKLIEKKYDWEIYKKPLRDIYREFMNS